MCLAALAISTPAALADTSDPLAESYKLEASNDLAGAARAMRKVVDASPSRYFPRLRLAYLWLAIGDYPGAVDGYRRDGAPRRPRSSRCSASSSR